MSTKQIMTYSMIAVIYIVLSLAVPNLSFGPVQLRIGEMLVVLPFLNKKYTYSLVIGCLITNLFSPFGIVDVVFGTTSTLLMCLIISRLKNEWLIPLVAGVLTGTMIGFEIYMLNDAIPLLATMFVIGAGELLTVVIGVVIFKVLKENNAYIIKLLCDQ